MESKQSIIEDLFYNKYEELGNQEHENDDEISTMETKIKEILGVDFINKYQDLVMEKLSDSQKDAFKEGFKCATALFMEASNK